MTIQNLIQTIDAACGIPLPENTVDRLIYGNENTPITGIVTTFMATPEVIRQAALCGANLIITHEPTFYTGSDKQSWTKENTICESKRKLLDETGIAVFRFHDRSHALKPDLIYAGMITALGWEAYAEPDSQMFFTLPPTTLQELSQELMHRLHMPSVRVVGNPKAPCRRVGFLLGALSLGLDFSREEAHMQLMEEKQLDVLVCGEMLEWTTCAYIRDAAQMGFARSMIVIGHNRSEEAGMQQLLSWLRPLCGEIPLCFIEAGDPYLTLQNTVFTSV